MKEHVLRRAMHTTFHDNYMTASFDAIVYMMLAFYFDKMFTTYYTNRERFEHTIDTLHDLAMNSLEAIEFTFVCDAINVINQIMHCDFRIEFDEYSNTMINSCYIITTVQELARKQQFDAHYDYNYCTININAYIAQYMKIYE